MELTEEQKEILLKCSRGKYIRTNTGFDWCYCSREGNQQDSIPDSVFYPINKLFDLIRPGFDFNVLEINKKGLELLNK